MADDIKRIENNVRKMIEQGAPESDIDRYLGSEGFTPEQFRNRNSKPPAKPLDRLINPEVREAGGPSIGDRMRAGLQSTADAVGDFTNKWVTTPARDMLAGVVGTPNMLFDVGAPWLGNKIFGGDAKPTSFFPSMQEVNDAMTSVTGVERSQAETPVGRVMQSGITGGFAGPAGLASGLLAETGGQVLEGTPYENPARIAGALLPFGAARVVQSVRPPPGVTVGKELERLSPDQFSQVQRLMTDAERLGTPITTAEAIAQVTGRKAPLVAQRAVEESGMQTPAVEQVQSMMTNRPATNRTAFDATVPPVRTPTTEIAPRVQGVAGARVQAERDLTNARTKPLYDTTVEVGIVDPTKLATISDEPAIAMAIKGARNDPIRFGKLEGLPDNHMKVLDAAKKYLDEYYVEGMGGFSRANITAAKDSLLKITDEAYPDYAAARMIQERRIRTKEEPLKRSATGRVADQDTLAGQYRKVFDDPLEVSADQVDSLVRDLAKADPQLAQDFVSRYLARVFNKANKPKTTKEAAGSTFANQVRGDMDVAANIEAAVKALPDGARRWAAINKLLDVYEAQGKRLPSGSPTQVKQEFARQNREGLVPRLTRLNQGLADRFADWRYSRNLEGMARLLVMSPQELGRLMMSRPSLAGPAATQLTIQSQQ